MRFIGFYRELASGSPGVYGESMPSPGSGVNYPSVEVSRYLRCGHPILDVMELTTDAIGKVFRVPGGSSVLTDGQFVWRLDLAAYVQHYALELPKDFLDFMGTHSYRVPDVEQASLVQISQEVSRKLNFRTDPAAGSRASETGELR